MKCQRLQRFSLCGRPADYIVRRAGRLNHPRAVCAGCLKLMLERDAELRVQAISV